MARAEGATGGTLDDVIDELQKLVKLTEVSNDIQTGIQSILTGRQAHAPRTPTLGGTPMPPPLPTPTGTMPHGPGGSGGGGHGGSGGSGGVESSLPGFFRRKIQRFKAWRSKARIGAFKASRAAGKGKAASLSIGKTAGRAGGVAAVVVGVVEAFNEARKAVVKWTDEAMKTAQQLSKFSGSMAAVMAQRDMQQMVRDIKRGEATAGSADTLMRAESRRKDEELKISIAVDNLKNTVLAIGNNALASLLKPLGEIAEKVNEIGVWLKIWSKPEPSGLGSLMGVAAAEDAKIVAAGNKMMELAKAGLKGAVAPAGAAPVGALPGPLP